MIFQPVRARLMYLWEQLWDFVRPLMCPAGSFCNAGTCAELPQTGIVEVDFTAESKAGARRLAGVTSLEARKKRSAKLLDKFGLPLLQRRHFGLCRGAPRLQVGDLPRNDVRGALGGRAGPEGRQQRRRRGRG